MYYIFNVVEKTTNEDNKKDVVKTTTEKSVIPKKSLTKEEVEAMIF